MTKLQLLQKAAEAKAMSRADFIAHYSIQGKRVNVTSMNSKLGHQIGQINMPAILTCCACKCSLICYALKGNYLYDNVQSGIYNNLAKYYEDRAQWEKDIIGQVRLTLYVRWHASGDIVDTDYLKSMVNIANACPNTKFLAFTKKFALVNDFIKAGNKLPKNLKIVFSAWDRSFKVENPYNFPITYVAFKKVADRPDIPALAIPCEGHCENCLACWDLKKKQSVVFNQH